MTTSVTESQYVYAGVAGFNLGWIAGSLSEIIAGSDGGSDVNEQITTLLKDALPNPPTQAQLDAFLMAVNTINTIPETVDTGDSDFGTLEAKSCYHSCLFDRFCEFLQ